MQHNDLLFTLFFVGFGVICLFLAFLLLMERRMRAALRRNYTEDDGVDGGVFVHHPDCHEGVCSCAAAEIELLRDENKKLREESSK